MANVSEQKRKAAPTAASILMETDERTAMVNAWEKKDPNFAYKFHRSNVSDTELQRGGYERVVEDGFAVNHNGDVLIKREKKLDDEVRNMRHDRSLGLVQSKLKDQYRNGSLMSVANPKAPAKE